MKNNKKGFTLAELLVVIAIIAVLVAIAIPVFSAATDKANQAVAEANARSAYAEYQTNVLLSDTTSAAKTYSYSTNGKTWKCDITESSGTVTVKVTPPSGITLSDDSFDFSSTSGSTT